MLPIFRALRHRNYKLFFIGQGVSLVGWWIQQLALNWLMYRMTGSALLLGLVSFASNIPVLLLAPVAGIVSDRFDLHRLMVLIQALEMLQAVALTVLAFGGWIAPWHIIALAAFMGVCVAFELPVRHAFMPQMVAAREDIPNAVALTSFISNGGRLIGPSIAGVVITLASEAVCFLINTLTYIVVLWTFVSMRVAPTARERHAAGGWQRFKEGAAYAWNFVPIRLLLAALAVMSFMAMPYNTLMPVIVREVYHGGADVLGYLVGSAGFGAFLGTGYLAWRSQVRGLVRMLAYTMAAAGAALVLFSLSRAALLSAPLLLVVGFGILATTVSVNMIMQSIVDDDKRGRVMSFYTMAFLGVSPLGALCAGALAEWIGASHVILIGGACCIATALVLARAQATLARPITDKLDTAGA
ncbi:MAG TPA: MFS transporter [Burkholderiales bacterium]|nr:MFS transporter [Burkholderiales bacterium]